MSQDDYHPPSDSKCLSSLKPFNYLELHGLWWTWYQIWLLQKKWCSPKKILERKAVMSLILLVSKYCLVKTYGTWHEKSNLQFWWDSDKLHTFSDDWPTKNVLFHMFLCFFQRKICSFFFSDETSIPSGANLILGQLSWFWQAGDRKEEGAAVTPRT